MCLNLMCSVIWRRKGLTEFENQVLHNKNHNLMKGFQDNTIRSNGSLVVAVQDSGVGLSAENQQMLFQEGVQFNANKLQAGGVSTFCCDHLMISRELHHYILSNIYLSHHVKIV